MDRESGTTLNVEEVHKAINIASITQVTIIMNKKWHTKMFL